VDIADPGGRLVRKARREIRSRRRATAVIIAGSRRPNRATRVSPRKPAVKAAYYEEKGAAAKVQKVGELPDPQPGAGEVRVHAMQVALP
jgi:hypothetical protein